MKDYLSNTPKIKKNIQKNEKLLIKALSLLSNDIKKQLHCFIIGGGNLQNQLNDYKKSLDLDNIVLITGQVKHEQLPYYFNSADIFCLSSISEGNPTVMFEALGCGIPYVGTKIGGVPEIIKSEDYGLLCESNDVRKLRNIIEIGLKKKWNNNKIAKYGLHYTWKNIFLQTMELY